MALMKYKDVLAVAKEKIKETLAPLRAREMRIKGELEVAKLEGEIAERDQKIQEHASEYPINFKKITDAQNERDLILREKGQLEQLLKELFGEE